MGRCYVTLEKPISSTAPPFNTHTKSRSLKQGMYYETLRALRNLRSENEYTVIKEAPYLLIALSAPLYQWKIPIFVQKLNNDWNQPKAPASHFAELESM